MSQTVPGEAGGGGNPSHSSNKFFHQPIQAPVRANFLSQGQGGAQYGSFIQHFPVKPANPHMGNGYPRPHGPMQFNMHSSHMNPQHQHMHYLNSMKGRNDNSAATMTHPYQQNHCGNLQYFSGGNYVTTVTVNPGDQQHHQNQLVHPLQQQYVHNPQNYYVNSSGTAMMNQMNSMQNMIIQQNTSLSDNGGSHKIQPVSVSSLITGNTVEPENKSIMQNKDSKINENSFLDANSPTNQKMKCNKIISENLCEGSNVDVGTVFSNMDNNGQKSNANSNSNLNNHKSCTNTSGNGTLANNRPRTNSRCDSVRSEAGESTCSSLSTESASDPSHLHPHSQQHTFNNKNNNHHHYHFSNNPQFTNNQIQPMNDFNGNSVNHSGNMNYQNYMACQARMNQVPEKPTMYNNPGIVQAFQQINTVQHVQVQHGQVQIMQQQYQSLQSPGIARQTVGVISNANSQQGQTNVAMIPAGNGSMPGQNMATSGMIPDHNHGQNLNVPQNCVGHSAAVPPPPQNYSASAPHGQFPHLSLIHSQTKAPSGLQQQNMMMGMTGPLSGGANPLNKGLPPVVVPFGWKRVNNNGQIIYISPSGSELRNPMEVCDYLTQENTCKCGLQCPLRVENIFCFDPKVPHRLTTPEELSSGEATKVCNHRRKLALAFTHHLQKQAKKEDGRKKRKRKAAEVAADSPSHSSSPSPAIGGLLPANQMVSFSPQVQPQQQDPSQMQQHHHQMQQQQQQMQMYQSNPNQNWNGMYGVPRVMIPNTGIVGCQDSPENYSSMNNSQGCSTAPPFANQHPQNCCENHHCFTGHQNTQALHQGVRPAFGGMNRPPFFCRLPGDAMFKGMVPPQGGCIPQQLIHHSMIAGNRSPHQPMSTNPVCRMPLNTDPMQQMFGNASVNTQGIPGTENLAGSQDSTSTGKLSHPEDMEKRRRVGPTRSRKKAKLTVDRNSPCPNVDVRNLRTENAVSPHTGLGPPFHSASPSALQNSSELQMGGATGGSLNGSNASHGPLPVSGPSFMEDPNGYLAQQTVLLNNTMSGGGVGQFSPQGARLSPRPSVLVSQSSPLPTKSAHQGLASRVSVPSAKPSPTVVPLPSNVPLPARVSKVSAVTSSFATSTTTLAVTSSCATLCTSVHSKSTSTGTGTSLPDNTSTTLKSEAETFTPRNKAGGTLVATAESSFVNHTVTVTYTHSSVTTTTCGSESNSPHSSQDTDSSEATVGHSEATVDENPPSLIQNSKPAKNVSLSSSSSSSKNFVIRPKITEQQKKKSDGIVPDSMSTSTCRSSSNTSSASSLSSEAANKPLTPGPAESSMTTQSPLEMVQNIVSSIPLPASSDELTPVPGKVHNHPPSQLVQEQPSSMHPTMPHQQLIGPHVYNMTGSNNVAGVMYSPSGGTPSMLRGTGSLVVHGATPSGSIPPGVLVSNSGNMVVVTSPFNSKVSVTTPVVCSNVSGIAPMVGVQAVPQVQVQPSLANVQSHQLQPIQPVQPVVQFVNTFATMQAPVIIQNGSNIIQSPSGVLSGHGSVIGPASIIPSSTPAFVTSQPLLAVDSSSHSSQMQMTQVVTSTSSEASDDSGGSRLTPVATPASTPTTPHSAPGSETPPSGGSSSGSGRKRKRRRNTSTPQGGQPPPPPQPQPQPQSIVPTIIMGKQLPQQMVMNSTQISQVAPYGSVAGAQVATVTAMGANGAPGTAGSQMLTAAGQPTSSINVVQMVGGPVTGPLPVHLQQPHTILVPSTATPGVIINQLPDGTFVSTDPNSGVTYPVQLQLSGSHIVGVSPVANSTSNPGVVASIATPSSLPQGAVVAVRPPPTQASSIINANTKLINISPSVASSQGETLVNNVYGVNPSAAATHPGIVTAPVGTEYSSGSAQFAQQLHPPTQATDEASLQQSLIVGSGNATLLQQKTTTIVAQHTTVVATQGGLMGTHSSVSTQTPGLLGESDVTSSDCVANPTTMRDPPTSPSHQSAEVTTTRQDEDAASTPESLLVSPQGHSSPEGASKKATPLLSKGATRGQEPHSATTSESGKSSDIVAVFWGFHRGHHYWPAHVLHKSGGEATVRWFGDHSVEKIAASTLSSFPGNVRKIITRRSHLRRMALDEAVDEARQALMISVKQESSENSSTPAHCSTTTTSNISVTYSDDIAITATTATRRSNCSRQPTALRSDDNNNNRKSKKKRKSRV